MPMETLSLLYGDGFGRYVIDYLCDFANTRRSDMILGDSGSWRLPTISKPVLA